MSRCQGLTDAEAAVLPGMDGSATTAALGPGQFGKSAAAAMDSNGAQRGTAGGRAGARA